MVYGYSVEMSQKPGNLEEKRQIKRFVKACPDIPKGKVNYDHESPDCLIVGSAYTLGIEHTRLFHTNREEKPKAQEIEGDWQKIAYEVQDQLSSLGEKALSLRLSFLPEYKPTKQDKESIKKACIEAAVKFNQNKSTSDVFNQVSLLREDDNVQGYSLKGMHTYPGTPIEIKLDGGIFVPKLTASHFEELIKKKESLIQNYRESSDKIWLLIFANDLKYSGSFETNEGVPKSLNSCGFDRVYFQSIHEFDTPILIASKT